MVEFEKIVIIKWLKTGTREVLEILEDRIP